MPRGQPTGRARQNLQRQTAQSAAQRAAQEQARYRQALQERQRAAHAKSKAADRAAAERLRRQGIDEAAKAAQARRAETKRYSERAKELQGIQVKRGDTAESIAKEYNLDPRLVAGAVTNLRPGQTISITDRTAVRGAIEDQAKMEQRLGELRAPREIAKIPDPALGATPFSNWIKEHILVPLNEKRIDVEEATIFKGREEERAREEESLRSMFYPLGFRGDPIEDPPEMVEARRIRDTLPEGMTIPEYTQALQERQEFSSTMRYTGNAFMEALLLQEAGEDYGHIVAGGTGQFEGNMLWITSAAWNNGEGDPMMEQFSPQMWDKIIGLGYEMVEEGLWLPVHAVPPDYGMGGYSFPGYGGGYGGGGGGGDYEYLSRGGILRRKKGGGESRGERVRVFPEGTAPSHWRI